MESQKSFNTLRHEIIIQNKNGVNFILAASICWLLIAIVWQLPYSDKQRALFTFFCTAPLMPLAWIFSKVFKTVWKIENNPLNELGLWLNFAQLFYFPFVFIFFNQNPSQMVMALAIITGAHFFPYGWFYKTKSYSVMAGVISVGTAILGTRTIDTPSFFVAAFMVSCLLVLSLWTFSSYKSVRSQE
ncbi:DUF7010 family protein [Roseivirga echinicomitans]|uniref:Uncharacterized protein n=1 Tax=Roseivirga echinicomitans TaxID=296218 RepID=A0A150XX08_9BACT|nr:hypothetical protein [Roseivirga echinicomitans]KYG83253.1 hypothetical protein AWN68_00110 [Roseivirga echinicomitans]